MEDSHTFEIFRLQPLSLVSTMLDLYSHDVRLLTDHSNAQSDGDTTTSQSGSSIRAIVSDSPFTGTDRFVLERRLGAGGFGVVYAARDRANGTTVALKTLQNASSESLYRFKREFRALADVSHPNLVHLYELGVSNDQWFFTMELVNGRHFIDHVCNRSSASGSSRSTTASLDRLIPALRQLIRGLDALHCSGQLHRDIKSSNVLITPEGRVVVLDFGLLLDLQQGITLQSLQIAGTPLYMSPEQGAGLPLTKASDFYSVGVMLYEALTGRPPFTGTFLQIATDKQRLEPPSPASVVTGVPPLLDALCRDLLRREPATRPSADEILDRLDDQPWVTADVPRKRGRCSERAQPFVGRRQQLGVLDTAFGNMLSGRPTVAAVFGPSGIGKSVLVKTFLDRIRDTHGNAVVLAGRCYERESVPYKALDSLVDALARYLKRLPDHDMRALLPRETGALAQLFPVLRQFHEPLPKRIVETPDSQELRRRAYGALRELLARIGDKHPLVLFIDDLQWGDVDSAGLLSDVMRTPDAPVLLLIAAYRDVESKTSPFLRTFLQGDVASSRSFVTIPVDRLTTREAQQLAAALLDACASKTNEMAEMIAAEAGGSPFFIDELVRSGDARNAENGETEGTSLRGDTDAREATIAHMIRVRLSRLPGEAQRLLRLAAVNARPIPEHVLTSAAYVREAQPHLTLLRAEHLLRARDTDRGIEFEAYHDRIRETVVGSLEPEELADAHQRLAAAFEAQHTADAELLAEHLLAARQPGRALHYTTLAAREAERALAFDRAARLYRRCLDLLDAHSSERRGLMGSLASALTNAGRGAEAADVYLTAPAGTAAESIDFKQKAAQQLLFGGYIDRGLTVLRDVLATIGLRLPETRRQTILSVLAGRLRVRLRGLGFIERDPASIAQNELMKIDACWSAAAGLAVVDTMRATVFQSHHLLLALSAGEIQRIHRALCMEVGFSAIGGSRSRRRVTRILSMTAALARRIDTPYAHAMRLLFTGISDYLAGRWTPAVELLNEAEQLFINHCTGVTWEVDSCRLFSIWAQYFLGHYKAIAGRFPVLLKDADDRGDLYASTMLQGHMSHVVFLASDDPASGLRHTEEAIGRWSQSGFHLQHMWALWSSVDIGIYQNRARMAWEKANGLWPALQRSMLLNIQVMRIAMLNLRGRAAVAAAWETTVSSDRARLLRDALRCAKAIEREAADWGNVLAMIIRASVHGCRGQETVAVRLFTTAEAGAEALHMTMIAAAARRRRGELIGGSDGAALIAQSEAAMHQQDICRPAAMTHVLAPWSPAD